MAGAMTSEPLITSAAPGSPAAAYGVTGEVTGLAADVPVFALFNSSKNVRLPDKIDAAMHCPVSLRLTPKSLDFRAIKEGSATPMAGAGSGLPYPTAEWQSINFADVVFVKAYSEPCEEAGKTSLQLGIPAAFRVNWCPKLDATPSCCSGDAGSTRVFASAIFVFGTSPFVNVPDDDLAVAEEGEEDKGEEGEPAVPPARPSVATVDKNLGLSRLWALKVFMCAFPDRYAKLAAALPVSIHTKSAAGSEQNLQALFPQADPESLPEPAEMKRDTSMGVIASITGAAVPNVVDSPSRRLGKHRQARPLTLEVSMSGHRRLLVFINPVGGSGKAVEIYDTEIAPLFRHARIEVDVFITTHQYHAQEVVLGANLASYEGIATVGGDGMLSEVVHGLMDRPDWAVAIKTPLAVLPGGSGNGLTASLLHLAGESFGPFNAAFLVARGGTLGLDMAQVLTSTHRMYSFLSFSWAIIADIDIESEKWRCCGGARFTWGGIVRAICLRKYRGRLSYLPAAAAPGPAATVVTSNPLTGESKDGPAAVLSSATASGGFVDISVETFPPRGISTGLREQKIPLQAPPLNEPLGPEWKVLEDDFVLVIACNVSHIAKATITARDARPDEHSMHLVVARGVGRCGTVQSLLELETGKFNDLSFVETIPVRAFRLEPDGNRGIFSVDGERIPTEPVQVEVHPSTLRVYGYSV